MTAAASSEIIDTVVSRLYRDIDELAASIAVAGPDQLSGYKFKHHEEDSREIARLFGVRENVVLRVFVLAAERMTEILKGKSYRSREELVVRLRESLVPFSHEMKLATSISVPLQAIANEIKRLAKEVPLPPLTSAANVEACAMGYAHLMGSLQVDTSQDLKELSARLDIIEKCLDAVPAARKAMLAYAEISRKLHTSAFKNIPNFLFAWRRCGYAKLEIGHKLAANLCLTDVPEGLFVHHPWKAWSLVMPDGLLGDAARVWCFARGEDEPADVGGVFVIRRDGTLHTELSPVETQMITNLVLGACLALSEPDEFRRDATHKTHDNAPGTPRRRKGGEPDFNQLRFQLSAPVKVDLREHVREALEDERLGRKSSSPKVQFIVRGHWRNQAHGPGRALRRMQWIQAFWKGPEESRILLRKVNVDG